MIKRLSTCLTRINRDRQIRCRSLLIEQDCRRGHESLGEWLFGFARDDGPVGSTLIGAAEGYHDNGRFHSIWFIEMSDRPLEITMSVDEVSCLRVLAAMALEDIDLAYVKVPVESARVGRRSVAEDCS